MTIGIVNPNDHAPISVIATVRNERGSIRAFLDSLLGQTRRPDELIIVDGASTDGTLEILREYEVEGKIKVVSRPCNIAEGRNLGVAAAQHELVAVTDAGCRANPDWLEQIASSFASDERPDVVAGNYDFETHTDFERASVLATDPPDRESNEQGRLYPSSRSVAFRKSAWQAVRGYPEWLYAAEDTLFNIRLRQMGFKFAFCRNAVVRWRPRTSWKALFRQHFNYARGNARIGLGLAGYLANIQYHAGFLFFLIASVFWRPALVLAALAAANHVRRNLWAQAERAGKTTGRRSMVWLTLAVMEAVRLAGMAGFVAGRFDRLRDRRFLQAQQEWMGTDSVEEPPRWPAWTSGVMLAVIPVLILALIYLWGWSVVLPAVLLTALLTAKSFKDFSRTGPQLKDEIIRHYKWYSIYALGRLVVWTFVIGVLAAGAGALIYAGVCHLIKLQPDPLIATIAAAGGIASITAFQFVNHLIYIPGSIAASSNYRMSRFHTVWRSLSVQRLNGLRLLGIAVVACIGAAAAATGNAWIGLVTICYALLFIAGRPGGEPKPIRANRPGSTDRRKPNILMLGADTLRADRLGIEGYSRALTSNIDKLIGRGTYFSACYVPCARTAPSLASMLTGLWPHSHGIRDNFEARMSADFRGLALPEILTSAGYRTIAISDWAGADLGKFRFGFESLDMPEDQWNIKYLIRQGPKDIRLFLSLFTHNRFGRRFLPEIYYLAGIPMTDHLGRAARRALSERARSDKPFLLNVFFSTTHAPFASEFPYYALYADEGYDGDSKFVMGLLNDPFEIIKRQRHTAKEFDLKQIMALYDGCVRRFDEEVGRILDHLDACGLADDTVVVIYSDHGIEFFERDSWGQGNSVVVDGSARIPLVISDPRKAAPRKADDIFRGIDIAPTLLELVGLARPSLMEGVSFAGTVVGSAPSLDLPAFGETGIWFSRIPGMPDGHLHYPDLPDLIEVPDKAQGSLSIKSHLQPLILRAKDRMVRKGRWKLVYMPMSDGHAELQLFDLACDPSCEHDVSRDHPQVRDELEALLFQWIPDEERFGSASDITQSTRSVHAAGPDPGEPFPLGY